MMSWSLMISALVLFCMIARRGVEDDTARMENMMRMRTIIHMILSPSKLSMKFQMVDLFPFLLAIPLLCYLFQM